MKRYIDTRPAGLLFVLVFSFVLLLISCSTQINGTISADSSANVSFNASLRPRVTNLIKAATAASTQENAPIIDGPAIARSIADTPGLANVSVKNTSDAAIEGILRITKISEFLNAGYNDKLINSFITFEQPHFRGANTNGRCSIVFDRTNSSSILEILLPGAIDYLYALMAPVVTGEEMTKTQYLELLSLFYNKAISDEIATSRIRASIEFPGNITSVRGGTFSGKKAEFDISLADVLVLEKPIDLEVQWR